MGDSDEAEKDEDSLSEADGRCVRRRIRRRIRRIRIRVKPLVRYLSCRIWGDAADRSLDSNKNEKMTDEYNLHLKTILSDARNELGADNAAKVISDLATLINQDSKVDADVAAFQADKPDSDEAEKDDVSNDEADGRCVRRRIRRRIRIRRIRRIRIRVKPLVRYLSCR